MKKLTMKKEIRSKGITSGEIAFLIFVYQMGYKDVNN